MATQCCNTSNAGPGKVCTTPTWLRSRANPPRCMPMCRMHYSSKTFASEGMWGEGRRIGIGMGRGCNSTSSLQCVQLSATQGGTADYLKHNLKLERTPHPTSSIRRLCRQLTAAAKTLNTLFHNSARDPGNETSRVMGHPHSPEGPEGSTPCAILRGWWGSDGGAMHKCGLLDSLHLRRPFRSCTRLRTSLHDACIAKAGGMSPWSLQPGSRIPCSVSRTCAKPHACGILSAEPGLAPEMRPAAPLAICRAWCPDPTVPRLVSQLIIPILYKSFSCGPAAGPDSRAATYSARPALGHATRPSVSCGPARGPIQEPHTGARPALEHACMHVHTCGS
jgi:hypothetical protein